MKKRTHYPDQLEFYDVIHDGYGVTYADNLEHFQRILYLYPEPTTPEAILPKTKQIKPEANGELSRSKSALLIGGLATVIVGGVYFVAETSTIQSMNIKQNTPAPVEGNTTPSPAPTDIHLPAQMNPNAVVIVPGRP